MTMSRRLVLSALVSLACATTPASAESGAVFKSTNERVAVLELFTSEGCSSCPPAEQFFSTLPTAPGLWTQFIPLAFHVDYWDYLGWKDGFATPAFTQRERQYAALWRSNQVYTPCFVMNGAEWRDNRLSLPKAAAAGVLTLSQEDNGWLIHFDPAASGKDELVFHLALLGSATSKVTAGENSGRTLQHDFTVLRHSAVTASSGRALIKLDTRPNTKAVAAWASLGDDPTPVQAAGGWLK